MKKNFNADEWIAGATEAAKYAKVSRFTIYEWTLRGKINPIQVFRGATLYSIKELDALKKGVDNT